jgi:hypothetical protein
MAALSAPYLVALRDGAVSLDLEGESIGDAGAAAIAEALSANTALTRLALRLAIVKSKHHSTTIMHS